MLAIYSLSHYGSCISYHAQCNRTVSLAALHTQIINAPTKIAVIGSGCSIATEASAEISHFYNLTQVASYTLYLLYVLIVCLATYSMVI